MLCVYHRETDPYFHLAAEEYLLKERSEDWFMLWRSTPSVIVGKHQNAYAEVNLAYVTAQQIPVVRRLSGGGTVFHDLGNLNFTFIMGGQEHGKVDFRRYTRPLLEVLHALDLPARFEGKNDLRIKGKKCSGNAEYLYKQRILHHGTLLFASQLGVLRQALAVDLRKYEDNSIKSIRSQVTNISEHLRQPLTIQAFVDMVLRHILETHPGAAPYEFDECDLRRIRELRDQKYVTWEWNFGTSPKYTFRNAVSTNDGKRVEIELHVERGIIREVVLRGDGLERAECAAIERILVDTGHGKDHLREKFLQADIGACLSDISIAELIEAMF
ncbi:lipoate--protein ligase [candidate division KSB3 bacterium]|uniref:lipoate--protein ligase n=1 Tax=candidate division KSB3 bacterium TaxID=2044937 RepID=A0A9D5Q686_9BACT|nr:lipoate--protein ligase [candidate division KSB3 bacterium]MBD3324661.1 lipoate--protein ligase [candidate division KSB3 bacterium]